MNYKRGDKVELINDTMFYKKGRKATVINGTTIGNNKKVEIRYDGEQYLGNDVDVIPKSMIRLVSDIEGDR